MSGIPPEAVSRAFELLKLERPRIRARDLPDASAKLDAWKAETLRPTWRRAVRACHPDFGRDDVDRARRTEEVKALNAAYELLSRVRIRSREEREAAERAAQRRAAAVKRRAERPSRYRPPPPAPPTPRRPVDPVSAFEAAFTQRVMAALMRAPMMAACPPPPTAVPWRGPCPAASPRRSAAVGLFSMVAANGYYGRFW